MGSYRRPRGDTRIGNPYDRLLGTWIKPSNYHEDDASRVTFTDGFPALR